MPLRSPDVTAASIVVASASRPSTSLDRRLPLMISGLLLVIIAAFGFLAFTEVRQSSLAAANGQLSTIVSQTGGSFTATLRTRTSALLELAGNPLVMRAVSATSTSTESDAAARFLFSQRPRSDTATFRAQLLIDAQGERILAAGAAPDDRDLQMLGPMLIDTDGRKPPSIGRPYAKDSSMWYWSTTPVSPGD
ncbi:MAG: hypothetical protein ABI120_11610, partial [Gemmatimonadaceae bacterium]